MRMNRWMLALALSGAAFAGCDTESSTGGDDAGMGGTGGATGGAGGGVGGAGGGEGGTGGGEGGVGGGEGGVGGGEGGVGGGMGGVGGGEGGAGGGMGEMGSCDAPYEFTDAGDGTWTATANVDGDDFQGSCSVLEDQEGNPNVAVDAVTTFTAPEAGLWVFNTDASQEGFDTVLYARTTCDDAGAELSCNDDHNEAFQSQLVLELEADQTIFLVADSYSGDASASFTITAEMSDATAPTLTDSSAVRGPGGVAITMAGMDPDDDVTSFGIALLDADGAVMISEGEPVEIAPVAFDQLGGVVESADGSYSVAFNITFEQLPELEAAASIQLWSIDAMGLGSDRADVAFAAPVELAEGDACVVGDIAAACGGDTVCIDYDEDGETTCTVVNPPSIVSAELFYNDAMPSVGLRIAGMDVENDVSFVRITLLDMGGEPIMYDWGDGEVDSIELGFGDNIEQADGNFTGMINGTLPMPIAGFAGMSLVVVDATDGESAAFQVDVQAPAEAAAGAECDLNEAFSMCVADHTCIGADAADPTANPICTTQNAPVIVGAMAYKNDDGLLGFTVDGTDVENNAAGVYVMLLDAEGAEIVVAGAEAGAGVPVGWASVTSADGSFMGLLDLPLNALADCSDVVDAAINECFEAGGGFECLSEDVFGPAEAACMAERLPPLQAATQVKLKAFDTTEQQSDWTDAMAFMAPGDLATGAACLPSGAIGACSVEGELCFGDFAICQAPVAECPADWTVTNLNDNAADAGWVFMGDTTDSAITAGGSCGGSANANVHVFTAAEAGMFNATIAADFDTVMYARNLCNVPVEEAELICNDDFAGLLSGYEFELAAGEAAYLFVDGYGADDIGPYTLTVLPGALPVDEGE
jgi:hypothetical protein